MGRVAGALDRVFFRPESLPPDAVYALALAPPVIAGLVLFRLPALEMLAIALAIGLGVQLLARWLGIPVEVGPALLAVTGVALCGPLSAPVWPALVAFGAAAAEPVRARYWPRAGINTGLLSYAVVYLLSRGAMAAYQRPGSTLLFPEPIAQWSRFYGGAAQFLSPVTLYVGNVAGPVFATSLLAVLVGMAWLWYARRLSLVTPLAFLLAGVALAVGLRWDPVFQLDSGPAWFVVGYVLADRRRYPEQPSARPVLAVATAVFGIGLRAAHFYIEALFLAAAVLEVVYALVAASGRYLARRIRLSRSRRRAETGPASA